MNLYLYGCGGHAKVILDILIKQGRKVKAFVDDNPPSKIKSIHNIPIYHASEVLPNIVLDSQWIVAIGNNATRKRIAKRLKTLGYDFAKAIHPSAQIAIGVEIAPGTVIMPNVVINTDTQIGHHVIINTGATIDHDCVIGSYCHIAPGCSLCGQVHVEQEVLLGVGSKVCPGMRIGAQTTCGAGSVVVKSLPSRCLAYGCPAKIIKTNNPS